MGSSVQLEEGDIMFSKERRQVAAVGAVIVLLFGGAAPAIAQTGAEASDGAKAESHCVATAEPNRMDSPVDVRCFQSFAEAISAATGGTVKVRQGQRALSEAGLAPTPLATSTVVGIEYKDANFGGSSLTLSTPGIFQCAGGAYVNWNSMPSGWDNTIGSARSYAGCKSGHFEYVNNGGSVRICGCATMGAMNDKTSSIRFSVSGL